MADNAVDKQPNGNNDEFLSRVRTAQSVNIPVEMFEKLYLSPANRVSGHLRSTFANPTPLFVLPPPSPVASRCRDERLTRPPDRCWVSSSPRRPWPAR